MNKYGLLQRIPFFRIGLFVLSWLLLSTASAAVPQAPVLRSPLGQITVITPNFKWTRVAGATIYQLSITDSIGHIASFQYKAVQKCTASSKLCTASPKIALPPGNARWRVRARNADGWGPWSAMKQITVNPATENLQDVLEAGDSYQYVTDVPSGTLLFTEMWRVLNEHNATCWISEFNTLSQYQFYEDPSFLPGPLYRFNGFDVSVGQLTVYSIGWYFRPGQSLPLKAAYVNAAIGDFLLVIRDADTFVEAYWQGNFLVATPYHIGKQCL